MTLRAAIVGLGRWGKVLVEASTSSGIEFVAAVSRDPSHLRDYAAERGLKLYDQLDHMLEAISIEAVVLATPHSRHFSQAKVALDAGRHVLIEKPITLLATEIAELVRSARHAGLVLAAAHNRRFLPSVRAVGALIDDGKLGQLLHVEGNMSGPTAASYAPESWRLQPRESPVGGMAGAGIHLVDLMIHFLGPVKTVFGRTRRQVAGIGMDDTSDVSFEFESGATGYLASLTMTAPVFRLHLFGTEAAAEIGIDGVLRIVGRDGSLQSPELATVNTETAELCAFASAVAGQVPYPVSDAEMIHGIEVFEAIERSVVCGAVLPVERTGEVDETWQVST